MSEPLGFVVLGLGFVILGLCFAVAGLGFEVWACPHLDGAGLRGFVPDLLPATTAQKLSMLMKT